MILVFATLFFLESINGMHFTKVAKRSETGLLRSIRIGHRECAGTEKEIGKQNEVTDRLNTNVEDFSLEAISKASMRKQQIEKHLHKDGFLSPSQLPCNFYGRPESTKYFSQEKRDEYVDWYFHQATNKVFLEVGSVDGVSLSILYFWKEDETGQDCWLNQIKIFAENLQWYIERRIV